MLFHNFTKCGAIAALIFAMAMGLLSLPASATLIGDTITITTQANSPLDTWTDSVLVGNGVELAGGDSSDHSTATAPGYAHLYGSDFYDIGANSITINYAALGSIDGFLYGFSSIFSDLDWIGTPGKLVGVSIASGAVGLIGSNISNIVDDGFMFQGTVDLVNGANFTLDLETVHDDPNPVPAPATLPILIIGLLGLTAGIRRNRYIG